MNTANRTPAFKKTLTPKDCEFIYGLNIGTLCNLRHRGEGPKYHKLGKKVLYRVEDIEQWLNENVVLTRDQRG